jgi:hypothetical protein
MRGRAACRQSLDGCSGRLGELFRYIRCEEDDGELEKWMQEDPSWLDSLVPQDGYGGISPTSLVEPVTAENLAIPFKAAIVPIISRLSPDLSLNYKCPPPQRS